MNETSEPNLMEEVFGRALRDYFDQNDPQTLFLYNSYGTDEEMPVELFFRQSDEFPELEHIALALCDGKVLDVGAGAGSHALFLQRRGHEVHALEQSSTACQIMKERGVREVRHGDFFQYSGDRYDTLLMMMNGIGLAGNLEQISVLLEHCKMLLAPGGQVLFDSSNLNYLYEDGSIERPTTGYYGEVTFQYEYKGIKGKPFGWVYVDQETMIALAQASGWVIQILYEDDQDQYLARLELKQE